MQVQNGIKPSIYPCFTAFINTSSLCDGGNAGDMGAKQYQGLFFDCFGMLQDIRQEGKVRHELTDILFIIVSALFAKIDEVEEIPVWARAEQNLEWLRQYIALENGIPSLSTFRRVLRVVDPKQFEKCFITWTKQMTVFSKTVAT